MPPGELDLDRLPEPVLDEAPELVALYRTAWTLAWDHVVDRPGAPQTPYLDEGFDPDTLWIWDTCFMVLFAAYASDVFPAAPSLDNFYGPMYAGSTSPLRIQHPDNPPLFAWAEAERLRHTGDLRRVQRILPHLIRHFEFFEAVAPGTTFGWSRVPTAVERTDRGYRWNGVSSGMDNTPRAPSDDGVDTSGDILWHDAAAQQALAARCIGDLARQVGEAATAERFEAEHARLLALLASFWNPDVAMFDDRDAAPPYGFRGVRTPATYWGLLAGGCDDDQVAAMARAAADPTVFGGRVPWPSLARDDPAFDPDGRYFRGGVWVPLAAVGARALARHGHRDLARQTTRALLTHMAATYAGYAPATIWECYSPTRPEPATDKFPGHRARPDFCGWSALAPIGMLIEHVLGFEVDAPARTVTWRRPAASGAVGIRRLRCGDVLVDAVSHPDGRLELDATGPVTVVVDSVRHALPA